MDKTSEALQIDVFVPKESGGSVLRDYCIVVRFKRQTATPLRSEVIGGDVPFFLPRRDRQTCRNMGEFGL